MKFKTISAFFFASTILFATSCSEAKAEDANTDINSTEVVETPSQDNPEEPTEELLAMSTSTYEPAPTVEGTAKVKMKTSMGDVTILLYDKTPLHKNNFVKLAKDGFYDGLLFHRIIKEFMVQGGDPESKSAVPGQQLGGGGPGYTIPAEIMPELYHKKGAVCAARLGGPQNPMKESSGCQFYIVTGKVTPRTQLEGVNAQKNKQAEDEQIGKFLQNPANSEYTQKLTNLQTEYQTCTPEQRPGVEASFQSLIDEIKPLALEGFTPLTYTEEQLKTYETIGGTPFLDNDYTVFGEVIEGLDIVEKIGVVQTAPGDRPVEDVKIISMEVIQ